MKLAILGGSFDPIHLGHLILADTVITNCNYDKVMFIPNKIAPHKNISGKVLNNDRLNMLKLSIEYDDRFILEEYELNNDRVSYTIDTLNYLYDNYNNIEDKIGLIIGADLIRDFDKWKKPEKIADICNIIVVNRGNDDNLCKENIDKYNIKVIMAPRIDISSSLIRNRIKNKKGFRYFVHNKVYNYILKNKLYF